MEKSSDGRQNTLSNERYLQRQMNKTELGEKMTRLRYELNSLSDKIGKSRDDDVSFAFQKQYQAKNRQYNLFKELKRKFQSLSLDKHRKLGINQSPNNLHKSYTQHRTRQAESPVDAPVGPLPTLSSQSAVISQQLQSKFLQYCKNKTALPLYFSEVPPASSVMTYKGFLLFMKHGGLEEVLTFQERLRIFNKRSKFKKRLLFNEFYGALEDFYRAICDKHLSKFTGHRFLQFLSSILIKLNISYILPQNHSIKKLDIHTGLFKESMQDKLEDSRKEFNQKRSRSVLQRKKLLARIQSPSSVPNRPVLFKQSQPSTVAIPLFCDSISAFKKAEPQVISYSSLMKNHELFEKRNRLQNEKTLKKERSKGNMGKSFKSELEQEMHALVDLQEQDTILEQMLNQKYKK